MSDYRDVQGFAAAVRFIYENNPGKPRLEYVRQRLKETVDQMLQDSEITGSATLGFFVERSGDGDLKVWVDPELAATRRAD